MGLSEIAAGIEVTAEQREQGVAASDRTDTPLSERLTAFDDQLPCSPAAAATLAEAYLDGAAIGRAAAVAKLPETTAAKTLYLLGEPIAPLSETKGRILDDWLAGDLSRTEARRLAGLGDAEFGIATYIATHDPIEGADSVLAATASVPEAGDPLAEARSDLGELI